MEFLAKSRSRFALLAAAAIVAMMLFAAAIATPQAQASTSALVSAKNPAVVINVSWSPVKFSQGQGTNVYTLPVKEKKSMRIYDVSIFPDRINLYALPNKTAFDKEVAEYRAEHPKVVYATAYRAVRETYCLKSVKVKSTKGDEYTNSDKRLKAYKSFFRIIKKKTPSKFMVVKYSGKGSYNFCGSLGYSDTTSILSYGVKTFGRKFAIIDYGTSSESSSLMALRAFAKYANYFVGSQQKWGGWGTVNDGKDPVLYNTEYDTVYCIGRSMKVSAKKIAALNYRTLSSCYSKVIKKKKIRASNTVVDLAKFRTFIKWRDKFTFHHWRSDLYVQIRSNSTLKHYYKRMIVSYRSTRALGISSKKYGINN